MCELFNIDFEGMYPVFGEVPPSEPSERNWSFPVVCCD